MDARPQGTGPAALVPLPEQRRPAAPTPPAPRTAHRLVDLIEAQTAATPDSVAVIAGDTRLTYRQLGRRADALARRLTELGAGPENPVGVLMPRGPDLLPVLLAVWKAGAPYLPLDVALPASRLAYMLDDSRTGIVVRPADGPGTLPADYTGRVLDPALVPADDPGAAPRPAHPALPGTLAYVIYTSGSTGVPKGVMVTHEALTNLMTSVRDDIGTGRAGTWLAATSVSFDISALELYSALLTGGRVVLAGDADARNPVALRGLADRHDVTHLQATPSGWRLLLAAGFHRPGVTALTGGEELPAGLAAELRARTGRLVNVYGPTETTIWSLYWPVPAGADVIRLGNPLANTGVHVLDAAGRPVPDGGTGELCLGGAGLARGYANRPDLTADRFRPDPHGAPGARLYRTGDLVRRDPGDGLRFLGRLDDQVKIRGHRIELGEIRARLLQCPGIRDAVVTVQEPTEGDKRLTAHLVPEGGRPDLAAVRAQLAETLPDYMIPGTFHAIARIPLTISGKVDHRALARGPRPARRTAGAQR